MNSLVSLKSEIIDLVGMHFMQQSSDFLERNKETGMHNAVGMASLDVLTSQTIQANVGKRNELQKEIGDLGTFWNERSIKEMRKDKKKEKRKRKSEPMIDGVHRPIESSCLITPPVPVKAKKEMKNSRWNRNRLFDIGEEEYVELSSDDDKDEDAKAHKKKNDGESKFQAHLDGVKKILLIGTDSSPPDKYANRAFTKIARNDIVAIEVLRTTLNANISPNRAKKRLVEVVAPPSHQK